MDLNDCVLVPNWFVDDTRRKNLTYREDNIYFIIGVEIFREKDTLSKELSVRFLSSLTDKYHSNISKVLKTIEEKGLIKINRSYRRGQGSLITLIPPEDYNKEAVL